MADQPFYPFLQEQKGAEVIVEHLNDPGEVNALAAAGTIWHRPAFAHVEFMLAAGQEVLSDGGAMIWKEAAINIETQTGECCAAYWRQCAGESCCQNKYTGPGKIAFSFRLPGDMLAFSIQKDEAWKLSAGSFICGSSNCRVSTSFTGCYAFICGGEECWLTKVELDEDSGEASGVFYAGGYGALTRHEVADGNCILMSSGCFFACSEEQEFSLRMPGGCCTCKFGGEGLVMAIKGPATVYTQNRNPAIWKTILRREGAKNKKKGGSGGLEN